MYKTPILLLIFNRPEKTRQVLEILQRLKPVKLYVVADGARNGNSSDVELCAETRKIALEMINWNCDLKSLFRENNLGCGKGVADAITWFYENEEEGIILEDDCLPDLSFFNFCSTLLDRYRLDERIMHIGGNNFQFGQIRGDGDYYYSFFSHNWGWATWRRAWKYFQYDIDDQKNQIRKIYTDQYKNNKGLIWFLDNRFNEVKMPQNHIWDIQWHFAIIKNKGLSITPNKNLVRNIGFGDDATHTKRIENWNLRHSAHKLETFKKPSLFEVENEADEYTMANHFKVYQIYNQSIIDTKKMSISKKQYIKSILKSILPPFIIFLLKKFFSASNKENQIIDYQNNAIEANQLPRYTVFETLFFGNKLKVLDNASFDFMNKELFDTEIYKFNTSTERPYIIDCGANIGLAIIYFKQIYPVAEILAFEPDPKVFDALKSNIQSFNFDNVTLINKAVWNKVEILKFYSEGADGGRKALVSDSDNLIEVQTVQLRDYITRKVDFLKIDIEGAEYEVLKDISDLLHNVERIFVEYHSFVGQSQHIPELLEIIKNAGFRLHISSPGFSSNSPFLHLTEYAQMDNQLNIFGFR